METPEKESIKDITKKLFKELNSTVNKGVSTFIHNVNSKYKNWSEPRVNKMNEKYSHADIVNFCRTSNSLLETLSKL